MPCQRPAPRQQVFNILQISPCDANVYVTIYLVTEKEGRCGQRWPLFAPGWLNSWCSSVGKVSGTAIGANFRTLSLQPMLVVQLLLLRLSFLAGEAVCKWVVWAGLGMFGKAATQ